MFGIVNTFRYLRDRKAILMSKLNPGKIKWLIWDYTFTSWQKLKRQFYIFRTLPFLRRGELRKRELGESFFLTIFTAWTLWFLCPPQSPPGTWNLMLLPQEKHWTHSSQGWPLGDAITLSQCYTPYPPHGINPSGAALCPPLLQKLWGSKKLLFQFDQMTHSLHDTGKSQHCPDPWKWRYRGMSHRCWSLGHTSPATASTLSPHPMGSWRTSHSHFIFIIWIENPKGNLNILWPWVVLLIDHILEIVWSFHSDGRKNPSSWLQWDLGWWW